MQVRDKPRRPGLHRTRTVTAFNSGNSAEIPFFCTLRYAARAVLPSSIKQVKSFMFHLIFQLAFANFRFP